MVNIIFGTYKLNINRELRHDKILYNIDSIYRGKM
jgi:hypothetical protein